MAHVKLGNKIFEGVEAVKMNTPDGGTVQFVQETGGGDSGGSSAADGGKNVAKFEFGMPWLSDDMPFAKVSDLTPTAEELVGGLVVQVPSFDEGEDRIFEGNVLTEERVRFEEGGTTVMISTHDNFMLMFIVFYEDLVTPEFTMTKGIYYTGATGGAGQYFGEGYEAYLVWDKK